MDKHFKRCLRPAHLLMSLLLLLVATVPFASGMESAAAVLYQNQPVLHHKQPAADSNSQPASSQLLYNEDEHQAGLPMEEQEDALSSALDTRSADATRLLETGRTQHHLSSSQQLQDVSANVDANFLKEGVTLSYMAFSLLILSACVVGCILSYITCNLFCTSCSRQSEDYQQY
eukprot:g736.t1